MDGHTDSPPYVHRNIRWTIRYFCFDFKRFFIFSPLFSKVLGLSTGHSVRQSEDSHKECPQSVRKNTPKTPPKTLILGSVTAVL